MTTTRLALILTALVTGLSAVRGLAEDKPKPVTIEGVAVATGQPLLFAKRAAWTDAMRNLAEQVLGVDFTLNVKDGKIQYSVRGDIAPAGSAKQVSAETLPTGMYRVKLQIAVTPAPPSLEDLPEITGEGKGDLEANRSVAAARAAAKAGAMAQAVKKAAEEQSAKTGKPIRKPTLEGHAYYLGPESERIEGNFYHMTAKFKVLLKP